MATCTGYGLTLSVLRAVCVGGVYTGIGVRVRGCPKLFIGVHNFHCTTVRLVNTKINSRTSAWSRGQRSFTPGLFRSTSQLGITRTKLGPFCPTTEKSWSQA